MSLEKETQKKENGKKRVLGDEWKDWDEEVRSSDSEASKGLFIGLCFLSLVLFIACLFLAQYLVSPRFYLLSSFLGTAVTWLSFFLGFLLAAWFTLVAFEVVFSRKIAFLANTHGFFLRLFYPASRKFSRIFRIDKDTFSNSFVKVSNFLIGEAKSKDLKKTLILLPRCLRKDIKEAITSMTREKNIPAFVVGGGEQARRIIEKENPDSVIAVACERDLVAGIRDVSQKLAVIGIPNKRPNGPCMDTCIDLKQFEEALKIFTMS
ncbi:MAG: DUF116 domain-containing protein [Candidatus Aureabacteria bacterium]|nr:DUF116 domain-containing protein [Candidatus Auribacterota bacterium]